MMKRLFVVMSAVMIIAFSAISASAVDSPSLKPTENPTSATQGSNGSNVTSPKTGVSSSYAIFAAFAVLACGGVATVAKKKLCK